MKTEHSVHAFVMVRRPPLEQSHDHAGIEKNRPHRP